MKQLMLPNSQDAPEMDFATLDLLPYGIIVVDEEGRILYYNAREEEIANRRREDVKGKNFFTQVAPCTQVQEFYGRFKETMHRVGLVADFHFHFPFPERPREVEITLTSFQKDGSNLCLISVSDVTEKDVLREWMWTVPPPPAADAGAPPPRELQAATPVPATVDNPHGDDVTSARSYRDDATSSRGEGSPEAAGDGA